MNPEEKIALSFFIENLTMADIANVLGSVEMAPKVMDGLVKIKKFIDYQKATELLT